MRAVIALSLLVGCGSEVYLTTDDDPPHVTLVRPVDLTIFDPAQPVELCALIEDNDPADALRVTLEGNRAGPLDGAFGDCEGGNYTASVTLDAFPNVLVLTAIDTRGQSTAVAVSLVPEDNAPPFCAWGVPADASEVEQGAPITVELTVGDPDSPASDLSFALRSTIDGTLVTTPPPSDGAVRTTLADLSPGIHDLSATVVDNRGLTATCGVQLRVLACVDVDRDGVTTCDGDCMDADPLVFPGGVEVPDGRDNDCNNLVDDGTTLSDDDGDGFREVDGDCDDADADRSPDAADAPYDGFDADCGGGSDHDADGDGFDADAYGGTDCADQDPARNPASSEIWYDGVDQDCDGTSDFDADRDGYDARLTGGDDCDDADRAVNPGVAERFYDGVDQDCRGDDDFDRDRDGGSSALYGGPDCDDDNRTIGAGLPERWYDGVDGDCAGGDDADQDGDGERADFMGGTDCDDRAPAIGASQAEVWYDGVDQDCSGGSDFDQDGDGQTAALAGGADCDDVDPAVFLGAAELWYDGVDQDCAGSDYDRDGDGFTVSGAPEGSADDCDDSLAGRAVHPGGLEVWYDGVDQDCDGGTDFDRDGDGFTTLGAPDGSADDCDDGAVGVYPGGADAPYDGTDGDCAGDSDFDADRDGQIAVAWGGADCDDADAAVFLGARERWYDGVNQDCAAGSDHDQDLDGYTRIGAPDGSADDCDDSPLGYAVHPNGVEVWYDGLDQDCDGGSDYDRDGDGAESAIFVEGGADCDDSTDAIAPGAPEARNGGDDDCDGACDEGLIVAGDLVITEIMRDSRAVDDSFGEWFEVYNASSTLITMCSDWVVADDGSDTFDVLRAIAIEPGAYAVFARNDVPAANGGLAVDYEYGGQMALSNGDDEIELLFGGVVIDRVAWAGAWPFITGHSVELDAATLNATANNSAASWCSATAVYGAGDFGTPGAANQACP